MIILEGTDNVGKTHLAKRMCHVIAERTGKSPVELYGHMSRPPADFDHVASYMAGVRVGVQDRYHLGSIVYGKILGGGSFPTARRMRVVQEYLRWAGCLVVIVTSSRESLRRRMALEINRDEMYSQDRILDAGDAYRGLSTATNMGTPYCDLVLDVSDHWPDDKEMLKIVDAWWQRFML